MGKINIQVLPHHGFFKILDEQLLDVVDLSRGPAQGSILWIGYILQVATQPQTLGRKQTKISLWISIKETIIKITTGHVSKISHMDLTFTQ